MNPNRERYVNVYPDRLGNAAAITFKVPEAKDMMLLSLSQRVVNGAAVGNRQWLLQVARDGLQIANFFSAAVAALVDNKTTWAQGLNAQLVSGPSGVWAHQPFPFGMWIPPGATITFQYLGGDVGDAVSSSMLIGQLRNTQLLD